MKGNYDYGYEAKIDTIFCSECAAMSGAFNSKQHTIIWRSIMPKCEAICF